MSLLWIARLIIIILQIHEVNAKWPMVNASQPKLSWAVRSDWVSVQAVCGAQGDGLSDDTQAIQRCLDNMTSGNPKPKPKPKRKPKPKPNLNLNLNVTRTLYT